jgi:hypothetical protein
LNEELQLEPARGGVPRAEQRDLELAWTDPVRDDVRVGAQILEQVREDRGVFDFNSHCRREGAAPSRWIIAVRDRRRVALSEEIDPRRMIHRVEERFERQARNEALMRSVNEQIAELSGAAGGWADADYPFDFQCECGSPEGCDSRVVMTRAAYERVRAQKDRFAVAPGHQTDEIEHVVEEGETYVIVDKKDEFEHFVE